MEEKFVNLSQMQTHLRACQLCKNAGYEITGPPVFSGNDKARVMLIGQAPGMTEVQNQRPFNFTAGTRLFQWLGRAGWSEEDFRARHYLASVTRCYPGKSASGHGDRVPTPAEQLLCAPWRDQELRFLDLKLIIPVGKLAISLYFDVKKPLTALIGQKTMWQGIAVVPLPHPSGASTWPNAPAHQQLIDQALDRLREIREDHAL